MLLRLLLFLFAISFVYPFSTRCYWSARNFDYMREFSKHNSILQKSVEDERRDNVVERLCIYLLSTGVSTIAPNRAVAQCLLQYNISYADFVTISKDILQIGNAEDIKNRIVQLLQRAIPRFLRNQVRKIAMRNPRSICEKSSWWMNLGFLAWLVGPCERFNVTVESREIDDNNMTWKSGVKLKKCRYLVAAGCKSACIHLCKRPTEAFFNEDLGVPLYMKPNFETYSCELSFGKAPPPITADPAYKESCFSTCVGTHQNQQALIKFSRPPYCNSSSNNISPSLHRIPVNS